MDKRILLTLALGAMSQVFAHAWEPKAVTTVRMEQSEWIVEVCRNGSEHVPEECFL